MKNLIIKYNGLTANEFIELWGSVRDSSPTAEETAQAMEHTIFRISVYDGQRPVAMAGITGDIGTKYYVKDIIVIPEYRHTGIGEMLITELMNFMSGNGISESNIIMEI